MLQNSAKSGSGGFPRCAQILRSYQVRWGKSKEPLDEAMAALHRRPVHREAVTLETVRTSKAAPVGKINRCLTLHVDMCVDMAQKVGG